MSEVIQIPKKLDNSEMQTGFCKFCQQGFQMETSGMATQEQLDQWATDKCGCGEAKEDAERKGSVEQAKVNMERLFRTDNPVLEEILKEALPYIKGGEIYKITISAPGGIKGTMFKNAKEKIVVKQDKQTAISLEA